MYILARYTFFCCESVVCVWIVRALAQTTEIRVQMRGARRLFSQNKNYILDICMPSGSCKLR